MSLAIEAFAVNAADFCRWTESSQHDVQTARQLLLALMQGIPFLPTDDAHEDLREYPRRNYEEWKSDHKRFSDFPFQYYRTVWSPCVLDDEAPVIGDLHDDLADIYGELWHGLQAWRQGDGGYAVRHWRESYFQHWGDHASEGVRAIDEHYRNNSR